jgi:hypothetical protein
MISGVLTTATITSVLPAGSVARRANMNLNKIIKAERKRIIAERKEIITLDKGGVVLPSQSLIIEPKPRLIVPHPGRTFWDSFVDALKYPS